MHLVHVLKVKSVVQFGKLKDNINYFWFVSAIKASVFFAVENTLAALINEVRTDWVFCSVQRFVPLFLLWQQNNSLVVNKLSM